jgi:hypothetical protein
MINFQPVDIEYHEIVSTFEVKSILIRRNPFQFCPSGILMTGIHDPDAPIYIFNDTIPYPLLNPSQVDRQ